MYVTMIIAYRNRYVHLGLGTRLKGLFTQEALKAYRSLEAYNYFFNGYVRTVFYYDGSNAWRISNR